MEKRLKIKCTVSISCTIIGIIICILPLFLKELSDMQRGYLDGFGKSFAIVSFAMFIKNLTSLKNAQTIRNREIELTDERNIAIERNSMAIAFRICISLQAILSIILVFFMDNRLGMYLGLLLGIELIIFIITNVIISKKI